jgi:hypothetical protein
VRGRQNGTFEVQVALPGIQLLLGLGGIGRRGEPNGRNGSVAQLRSPKPRSWSLMNCSAKSISACYAA